MSQVHVEDSYIHSHDPFHDLGIAIIKQAANDYRIYGRRLRSGLSQEEQTRICANMKSITRFFLSDWFDMLSSGADGSQIVEKLDEEVFEYDGCA